MFNKMNSLKAIRRYLRHVQGIRAYSNVQNYWQEVAFPVPWGEIRGKWWGPMNVRPIVALHGWQDSAGSFDRLIPLLNKDISFLAIDLPGHGYSSWLPPGGYYQLITYWLTIKYIKRYLNWPKLTLMGHSLGGITSYSYTVIFPDEVDFLICIDGMKPLIPLPRRNNYGKKVVGLIKQCDFAISKDEPPAYPLEEILQRVHLSNYSSVALESAKYIIERNIAPSKIHPGKYYFIRDPRLKVIEYNEISQAELVVQAENLKCPIFGTKSKGSDYFEKKENFYEFFEVVKKNSVDWEFHYVDGTHHAHLNNPENIAPLLSKFIEKHNVGDRHQDGLIEDCIVTDKNFKKSDDVFQFQSNL